LKISGTGLGPMRVYCSFLTIFYNYSQIFAMESEIEAYIKRAIVDIARKCNVKDIIVIKTIKQILTI
jgi:hypothetical protein